LETETVSEPKVVAATTDDTKGAVEGDKIDGPGEARIDGVHNDSKHVELPEPSTQDGEHTNTNSLLDPAKGAIDREKIDGPGEVKVEDVHNDSEYVEPPETQGKDQDDRDRDLKATKADDAAVPIWLWNDAIRSGLGSDPGTRGHDEKAVDWALEVLKVFLLCRVSRLGVTRSYFQFIHTDYPGLHVPERVDVLSEACLLQGKQEGDDPIPS
jgi:hypothetical protein